MDIETLRDYCLSLPLVVEKTPFGDDTLCYCLDDKMFLYLNLDTHTDFAVMKCDPDRAVLLRERYNGITPGYHINKRHWNSVYYHADVDAELFLELVRHAYNTIIAKMPKCRQCNYTPL